MRYPIWLLLLLAPLTAAQNGKNVGATAGADGPIVLAVIVSPKNPVKKISFGEFRAYLKMERQFWPDRTRCDLYLPPSKTGPYRVLLKTVYRMSHKRLSKYWVRKLFSGDIPAKPSYVPNAAAAGSLVAKHQGALTVVDARTVPEGVRVLPIDGKKPGDAGYPLVGKASR